jgi:hypothetical protein
MSTHSPLFKDVMDASLRVEYYILSAMTGLQSLDDLNAKQKLIPRLEQ